MFDHDHNDLLNSPKLKALLHKSLALGIKNASPDIASKMQEVIDGKRSYSSLVRDSEFSAYANEVNTERTIEIAEQLRPESESGWENYTLDRALADLESFEQTQEENEDEPPAE